MNNFSKFNIDPMIIKALDEQEIVNPSEIQEKVIPLALGEDDIVAKAPTGTGKTLGYTLPIISKVDRDSSDIQALILCPTRELVTQICEVFQKTTKYYESFRTVGLYGGQNIQKQLASLRRRPHVIVGTPGRILDHLRRHTVKFHNVKMFVLDEGDEMFDMGFRDDIESIMDTVNPLAQKLLFSATIPKPIEEVINAKFKDPKHVATTIDGDAVPDIDQYYTMVKDSQRVGAMLHVKESQNFSRCIVFCNTKARVEKLYQALEDRKQSVAMLHGDLRQNERSRIMKRFKNGEIEMLVATDVAARGIDVDCIDVIFNFDPPTDADFYVHRIGRTARASAKGSAYTFIDASQVTYIQTYQKATNNALKYIEMPTIDDNFTMPRDGSNRLHRIKGATKRFFLSVGGLDMLDKESLSKLVMVKCGIEMHEIVDVKVRDMFSFVEVLETSAKDVMKLKGLQIGKRILNIEEARGDEERGSTKAPRERKSSNRESKPFMDKKSDIKAEIKSKDVAENSAEKTDKPKREYSKRVDKSFEDKKPNERKSRDRFEDRFGHKNSRKAEVKGLDSFNELDFEPETKREDKKSDFASKKYPDARSEKRTYSSDKPRKSYGEKKFDDKKSYSSNKPRKSYGERKFDDKKSYSSDKPRKSYGEKKFDDKKSYSSDRPKKSYSHSSNDTTKKYSDKKSYSSSKSKSFGDDRPRRRTK